MHCQVSDNHHDLCRNTECSPRFGLMLVGGAGLHSLSMPGLGPAVYMRHDAGLVYRSDFSAGQSDTGDAMDASFRIVPVTPPRYVSAGQDSVSGSVQRSD